MTANIPHRFPARLIDRYCDFFTPICEMMIQLEMEFDRGLDAERLAKAVDLALDAEPILGCRFADSSYKPYFERLEPGNRSAFSLGRSDGEYESFKSRPMDYRKGPQISVCLWQSPGGDRLLLKVAHHVADAGGVKDIASMLSGIYRDLLKDPDHHPSPNVKEQRGLRQILRHVPLHAYPRIYLNSINPKGRVPRALPVGECKGGDMVRLGYGSESVWAWSLSDGIPCGLDSEISPPYPESRCAGISKQAFSEGTEESTGV